MIESINHPRALATARPSSLADRVDLVKDDDVQAFNDEEDDDGDDEDICDCAGGQKSNAIVVFQFRQHHQRTEEAIMVSIKQCLGKRT